MGYAASTGFGIFDKIYKFMAVNKESKEEKEERERLEREKERRLLFGTSTPKMPLTARGAASKETEDLIKHIKEKNDLFMKE